MSNITAKRALGGSIFEGHGDTTYGTGSGEDIANNLTDIIWTYAKPAADSMAGDATTLVHAGFVNPYPFSLKIISAKLVSGSALSAHDTNYATITFQTDDAANGTPAVAITWATTAAGTGSWVADTAEAGTLTAAATTLVSGASLHFAIAKAAAGVVVPITHFAIVLRKLG